MLYNSFPFASTIILPSSATSIPRVTIGIIAYQFRVTVVSELKDDERQYIKDRKFYDKFEVERSMAKETPVYDKRG